ncbi:hypothetical protein ACHAWF_011822 [Thalassiosira exigua]
MGCTSSAPVAQPAAQRQSALATPAAKAPPAKAATPKAPAAKPQAAAPQASSPPPPPEKKKAETPVDFLLDLTDGRPLDASDATDLEKAKHELRVIRKFAKEYLDKFGLGEGDASSAGGGGDGSALEEEALAGDRGALYDKQDFGTFEKVRYEKSDAVRELIYDAVRPNVLFEHDSKDEVLQIIDVFEPREFQAGEEVIKQGDRGDEFYVVESGELSIRVTVKGEGGGGGEGGDGGEEKKEDVSQLTVGSYSAGAAFGELALIFGSPRAATITATTDCKLWSIERTAYRSVISQLRYEQHKEKAEFLRTCVVSDRRFSDIFDGSQIEDLTIATKVDTYEKGDVVLREGETGDTFYIVQSGTVETLKSDTGDVPHVSIGPRQAFGTTSLLRGSPSRFTYRAATRVTLYYLTRSDFEDIMGSFQDALDGNTVARSAMRSESRRTLKTSMTGSRYEDADLDDLVPFNILGRGAFGRVSLVQSRKSKRVFALKAQSKHYIAQKGQREHVLNEYRIMREIEHPCILGMHCALQDERHLYFLLDLLPGETERERERESLHGVVYLDMERGVGGECGWED